MSEMERDSRVDTAWKAASREEPPVALDDAIRAAARKAVDTQPRRARDKHWWYPYAAAATVAVIAAGLLQVTPPEQVTPTIVADADRTQKQDAPAVVAPAPPPEASPPTMAAPAAPPSKIAGPSPALVKKESRESEAQRAAALAQNATQNATQRELDATDKLAQPTKPAKPTKRTEPAERTEGAAANKPAQLQASPAPAARAPLAEPFPGAPQSSARSAPVERRDSSTSNANAMESAPAQQAAAAPSAAAARLAGSAVGEQRAQRQAMLSKDEVSAQPRAKTATPRSVEDWIKLIRELRSEGRIDEARKEIVAFRNAYGEQADSLLPQDLREFAPPAAKQ